MVACTACSKANEREQQSGNVPPLTEPEPAPKAEPKPAPQAEPKPSPKVEMKPKPAAKNDEIKLPLKLDDGIVPDILYIPAIKLHARVQPVPVLGNGQMGVPSSTDEIGYLADGILPGEPGNAAMDGHVDSYTGPAVFFRLNRLKAGDDVYVKSKSGCKIRFSVESVEIFKTADAPLQRIFGPAKESRLNLITCAGKYSRKKKEHQARLVVFTKRVAPTEGCKQEKAG